MDSLRSTVVSKPMKIASSLVKDNREYCEAHNRPQIYFLYAISEMHDMTTENLVSLESGNDTEDLASISKLDAFENEMNITLNAIDTAEPQSRDKLWNLLPIATDSFEIINYIAFETDPQTKKGIGCKELTLDIGTLALFRLGYTVYSPEFVDDQVHEVMFVHPNGVKLYHENSKECNYYPLWLYLKGLCDFIK